MKPIKALAVIAIMLSTTLSWAQWNKGKRIKGNGEATTVSRELSAYEGVKATGPMDIKLVEGKEGNITIKGESNLIEYIETEIKYNNLIIKVKDGINLKTTRPLLVIVPYESIEFLTSIGSGDINNTGTIKSNEFEVSIQGSGDVNLKISSSFMKSKISGSGDIVLSGNTDNLNLNISGSGDFNSENLKSTDVDINILGSGTAKVYCNGILKARVSGSGDVIYKGNPKTKDTKVYGSGSIRS